MQKRLNKKFLVGLVATVAVVVLVVVVTILMLTNMGKNPTALRDQARAMVKANDITSALDMMRRAAMLARKSGKPVAADICIELGDLLIANAAGDMRRYEEAQNWWQQASALRPDQPEAFERMLNETYKIATERRNAKDWERVEELAGQLIRIRPNDVLGYHKRAESLMGRGRLADLIPERRTLLENDLKQARELAPDDVLVLITYKNYCMLAAEDAIRRNAGEERTKWETKARDLLEQYIDRYPDKPKAKVAMVRYLLETQRLSEAEKVLKAAMEAHPKNSDVLEIAVDVTSARRNPEGMRQALEALVANDPVKLIYKYRLAEFYRISREPEKAIISLRAVVDDEQKLVGVEYVRRENIQREAMFWISQAYMDLADSKGPDTAAGKEAIKQVKRYIERFRDMQPTEAGMAFLDGRYKFLTGDYQGAVSNLKKADLVFSAGPATNPLWAQSKVLLAECYARVGETGLTIKLLDDIISQHTKVPAFRIRRAELYLRVARYNEAIHSIDPVILDLQGDPANRPMYEESIRLKATALLAMNQTAEAEELLKQVDAPSTRLLLARVYLNTSAYQKALDTVNPLLQKDATDENVVSLACIALLRLQRTPEAMQLLEVAQKANPKSTQLQVLAERAKNPNVSELELQKLIIDRIDDPFERARTYADYWAGQRNVTEELQALLEAERIKPDSDVVVERIFIAALRKNDLPMVEKYAKRAEAMNADGVSGKFFLGRWELAKGNRTMAIQLFREGLVIRPEYSPGWTYLGQAQFEAEQTGEAIASLTRAVEQRPDNLAAMRLLIQLYASSPESAKLQYAQNYLRQAQIIAPNDPQLRSFEDLLGDPRAAIERREAVMGKTPNDMDNIQRLALLYVRQKEPTKALTLLRRVAQSRPEDLEVANAVARLLRDDGKINDAFKIYEPFSGNPDKKIRVRALLYTGDMHRSLSQVNEAVSVYKSAIQLQGTDGTEAMRRLGDLYFETEDMPQAEAVYFGIYNQEPQKDIRITRRYIETLIRQNKIDTADIWLTEKVLRDRPRDPEGLVLRGFAFLQQKKPQEAIKAFETVIEDNPSNTDALFYRALTNYSMLRDPEKAIGDLQRIRMVRPEALRARLTLARAYRTTRQFSEAILEYQAVLGFQPDLQVARSELSEYLFMLAGFVNRFPPDSTEPTAIRVRAVRPFDALQNLLADSIRRYPNQAVWRIILGNLLAQQGRISQAVEVHKKLYAESQQNVPIGMVYTNTLLQAKEYQLVVDITTELLAQNKMADLYLRRGSAQAALKKVDAALADFAQSMDLMEKDPNGQLGSARALMAAVEPNKALAFLRERIKTHPDALLRLAYAQSLMTAGQMKDAVAIAEPLLKEPTLIASKAQILRVLASGYYQAKDYGRAMDYYQELLILEPNDVESLNNAAYLLADDLKRPRDAKELVDRAERLAVERSGQVMGTSEANVWDTIGWVRFLMGDSRAALTALAQAVDGEPLPIAYYHIAQVHRKASRLVEAKGAVERAIQLAREKQDPILKAAEQLREELR